MCTAAKEAVSDALRDIDNRELVAAQLREEENVLSQVEASVNFVMAMAPTQVTTVLNLLQVLFRSNALVSALNTNAVVTYHDLTSFGGSSKLQIDPTYYLNKTSTAADTRFGLFCTYQNPTAPAGFYSVPHPYHANYHRVWPEFPFIFAPIAFAMIDGFFGGCTPLDALLASTLDCFIQHRMPEDLA